jgi:hypothetical protein
VSIENAQLLKMVEANSHLHAKSHLRYQRGFTNVEFPQNVQTRSGAHAAFHLIGTGCVRYLSTDVKNERSLPIFLPHALRHAKVQLSPFSFNCSPETESTKHSSFNESLWQHFHGMPT